MSATNGEQPPVEPIHHLLSRFTEGGAIEQEYADAIERALVEREDTIVGLLHGAGAQFGLFPQIVAEVLAELGLGSPRSDAERTLIRQQFNDLMEQIMRAQRGEGPMPTP